VQEIRELSPVHDRARPASEEATGLPPVPVFFALVAVVALVTGAALVSGPDTWTAAPSQAAPIGSSEPPVSQRLPPSRASASHAFAHLRQQLNRAIKSRNPTLLSEIFTARSSLRDRVSRIILRLKQDDVVDQTRIIPLETKVDWRTDDTARIREQVRLRPCFVTERGKDVTDAPSAVEQLGTWILKWEGGVWRISSGALRQASVVEKKSAHC
jgi:hypothetical protein